MADSIAIRPRIVHTVECHLLDTMNRTRKSYFIGVFKDVNDIHIPTLENNLRPIIPQIYQSYHLEWKIYSAMSL